MTPEEWLRARGIVDSGDRDRIFADAVVETGMGDDEPTVVEYEMPREPGEERRDLFPDFRRQGGELRQRHFEPM